MKLYRKPEIVVVGNGDGVETFLRRGINEGRWCKEVWYLKPDDLPEEVIITALVSAKRVWVYGVEMGESFGELKKVARAFDTDFRFQISTVPTVENGKWRTI